MQSNNIKIITPNYDKATSYLKRLVERANKKANDIGAEISPPEKATFMQHNAPRSNKEDFNLIFAGHGRAQALLSSPKSNSIQSHAILVETRDIPSLHKTKNIFAFACHSARIFGQKFASHDQSFIGFKDDLPILLQNNSQDIQSKLFGIVIKHYQKEHFDRNMLYKELKTWYDQTIKSIPKTKSNQTLILCLRAQSKLLSVS